MTDLATALTNHVRLTDHSREDVRTWLNTIVPHLGRPLLTILSEHGLTLGDLDRGIQDREVPRAVAEALERIAGGDA